MHILGQRNDFEENIPPVLLSTESSFDESETANVMNKQQPIDVHLTPIDALMHCQVDKLVNQFYVKPRPQSNKSPETTIEE